MQIGTIAVRAALPPAASHIIDKEIQESLWHYYYDVEKSVAYLVSKYVAKPKAQKKEKTQGEKKLQGGLISLIGGSVADAGCGIGKSAGGGLPFVYTKVLPEHVYS